MVQLLAAAQMPAKGAKIVYQSRGQNQFVPRPINSGPGEFAGGGRPEIWFVATATPKSLERLIKAKESSVLTRDLLRKARGASKVAYEALNSPTR